MSCDRLYFLHSLGDIFPGARQITDRLWVGGDFDTMRDYINSGYPTDGQVRFFIGYSGWDAGQLENELHDHVWAVTEIPQGQNPLIGSDDAYWHKLVRSMARTSGDGAIILRIRTPTEVRPTGLYTPSAYVIKKMCRPPLHTLPQGRTAQ